MLKKKTSAGAPFLKLLIQHGNNYSSHFNHLNTNFIVAQSLRCTIRNNPKIMRFLIVKVEKCVKALVLHHSTTHPTTLLGCWAKFRTGLPPYRSGLVDGKCVWRLSRRVSLTPLCIACLDLTSTTSGRTMWPRWAVTGLQHLHFRPIFFLLLLRSILPL